MVRPLLPPRGYFIPTQMIYQSQMPSAVFLTWLQLRGLAWGGTDTPSLCIKDLVELTGKTEKTLTRHINQLEHLLALRYYSPEQGIIVVKFPKGLFFSAEQPVADRQKYKNIFLVTPPPLSLPIPPDSDSLKIPVVESEKQESDQDSEGMVEGARGNAATVENTGSQTNTNDPVNVYRLITRLTPNPSQRRLLLSTVTDLVLWQQTLEHWIAHGWNPMNLAGMLELYARGGSAGCRYCRGNPKPRQPADSASHHSSEVLEELRRELDPHA